MKFSQRVSELLSGHDFTTYVSKGHTSVKNEDGLPVFNFCTLPDSALYLYQVSQEYPNGF